MAYMLTWLETILTLLPALAANGAPVLLRYAGTPIDAGKLFVDGRRLLGDGKTWEGFATGSLYGSILAILISVATCNPLLAYGGILASLGAMLGDMFGAFIKRRLGLERGAPAPILDQLDFYSGSLIALYLGGVIVEPITSPNHAKNPSIQSIGIEPISKVS